MVKVGFQVVRYLWDVKVNINTCGVVFCKISVKLLFNSGAHSHQDDTFRSKITSAKACVYCGEEN